MPQLVPGEGNPNAKIYIIGEAPGEQEERQGRPFIGGAGKVLDGMLSEVGIKRANCYIDNVIQRRPPKNDFSIFYRDKGKKVPTDELLTAHARVRELVGSYRPNVLIALGNEALFATTGKKQITHWRGSLLDCDGVKVIPTIHPAMVMRQYEFRPTCIIDLNKAKAESLSPSFPTPYQDRFSINPSFTQVMDTIKELHSKEYLAFDIETGGEQIICIGFGWSREDSICIPIFYGSSSWWTSEEELAIIHSIRELFSNPKIKFIAQNAQFDMIYLADKWGVEVANLWMDTMIAFHCCYPEMKKGLDFLCSVYTNRPYYKGMPGTGGPDVLWKYNCLDTVVTYECAMEIRKELDEFHTLRFYQENSHKLIKPLIQMQRRGILIDLKKREAIANALEKDLISMTARLHKAVGHELNPLSPKQMKEFLYNEMKLPPQIDSKSGNLTADEEALETLFKKYSNPVFNLIMDIRKVRKLLSTYLQAEVDRDGRMRCSYVITGTTTGRLSSRESVYGRGCLLPEAQVLTPVGWERLDNLGSKATVMQWKPNGELNFVNAEVVKFPFNGNMLKANSDFHRNVYTPEHRIPTVSHHTISLGNTFDKKIVVKPAMVALQESLFFLPVSGNYSGSREFPLVRILVMAQADGCIETGGIRFGFKKQRKIDRFLMLMKKYGLRYTEEKARLEYRRFRICAEDSKSIIELLGKRKLFDSYVLLFTNETLKEFIDELQYWDGHVRGKSFQYYTGVEQNACIAATVAHLCGYSSSTRVVSSRTFAPVEIQEVIPGKLIYTVAIKPRAFITTGKHHVSNYPYNGEVYCVTTKSGFFLTKYNDRICVTGNTNLQNIPRGEIVRSIFIPDPGKFFINADLSQAEARVVAYLSGEERLQNLFSDSKQDIHKRNAAMVFNKRVEEVTEDERQLAKTLVHAANYGIGPRRFAKHIGSSEDRARDLLNQYYALYPSIKLWHREVEHRLGKTRILRTPLGRARQFFGRWSQDLVREAIAYVPQSTVSDVINLGIINSFPNLPPEWELLLQVHDSILMQVPIGTPPTHIHKFIQHYFEIPVEINNKTMVIPVDIKCGSNWGKLVKMEI